VKKNSTYTHTTSWTDTLCPCKLCANLRKSEKTNIDDFSVIKVRGFGLNTRLSEAKKYAKEIMGSAKRKKLTKAQYLKLAEMIRRA